MRIFLVVILLSCCLTVSAYTADRQLSQHKFHHPQAFKQALKGDKDPGAKVYQKLCANCHAVKPLIPLGAPRIGVVADWTPRMTRNIQEMFTRVDQGFNTMPARGGCFECSDSELKAAIKYMLPKKKD